jgi:hypothetical protein
VTEGTTLGDAQADDGVEDGATVTADDGAI